jgi:hypothetical protein
VEHESVYKTLLDIYVHVVGTVVPALTPFLSGSPPLPT